MNNGAQKSQSWKSQSWSNRIISRGPFGADRRHTERFEHMRDISALEATGLETQQQLEDFAKALPVKVEGHRELSVFLASRLDIHESGCALVSKVDVADALGVPRDKLNARLGEVHDEGVWDLIDENTRTLYVRLSPWGCVLLEAFLGNAPTGED